LPYLSGTNAPVERVFPLMNDLWTENKSQKSHEIVKSVLITKVNLAISFSSLNQRELEKVAQGIAQCEVSAYARSCRRCVATYWKDQTQRAQNCKYLR